MHLVSIATGKRLSQPECVEAKGSNLATGASSTKKFLVVVALTNAPDSHVTSPHISLKLWVGIPPRRTRIGTFHVADVSGQR